MWLSQRVSDFGTRVIQVRRVNPQNRFFFSEGSALRSDLTLKIPNIWLDTWFRSNILIHSFYFFYMEIEENINDFNNLAGTSYSVSRNLAWAIAYVLQWFERNLCSCSGIISLELIKI